MTADINAWGGILQSLIAAGAALLGVSIGGWITASNQKYERRNARILQQLEGFYSPMLGMCTEIDAKRRFGENLSSVADSEWHKLFDGLDPQAKERVQAERWPAFEKSIKYRESQQGELASLYEKMLEHFSANMWLAEPSTRSQYKALSDFVEIKRRLTAKSIPRECFNELGHSEESLKPLYKDLEDQFKKLTSELRK